ncbi:hypothetical protein D3C73_1276810 [compost metagenome]
MINGNALKFDIQEILLIYQGAAMTSFIGFIVAIIVLSTLTGMMQGNKKKRRRSTGKRQTTIKKSTVKSTATTFNRSSTT